MPTNIPSVSVPGAGGSLRKISEKFQAGLYTGTSQYHIPLDLTSARGLTPQLALSYSSGFGNGVFGHGFFLGTQTIKRRTSHGIPSYDDEQDVFILGGEDLVSMGKPTEAKMNGQSWCVTNYQPRTESTFAVIEYWCKANPKASDRKDSEDVDSESFWLVRERNGVNHRFGYTTKAQINDPKPPTNQPRTFCWLIDLSTDANGNCVEYTYREVKEEANRYLATIQYGNYPDKNGGDDCYACTVEFDYSDKALPLNNLSHYSIGDHPAVERKDVWSSYSSGFCLKKQYLCHHIRLWHHLQNENEGKPFLVKSWELSYQPADKAHNALSMLTQVQEIGYRSIDDKTYLSSKRPAITFDYSKFSAPKKDIKWRSLELNPKEVGQMPGNLSTCQFVDLYREGIPGILYSDDHTSYFWRAAGNGQYLAPEFLSNFPTERDLQSTHQHFLLDLAGNHSMAFVVARRDYGGFYFSKANDFQVTSDSLWADYQAFEQYPSEFTSPDAMYIDLEGRGQADVVVMDDLSPHYYPAQGMSGYAASVPLMLPNDFPVQRGFELEHRIQFASILGDGLLHRVKISAEGIFYWPNLGQGQFGEKQAFGSLPKSLRDNFDSRRLYLVDINASGAADLAYLVSTEDAGEVSNILYVFLNNGQQFSDTPMLFPFGKDICYTWFDKLRFVDLLGQGSVCALLDNRDYNGQPSFYDLTQGDKPYLLTSVTHGQGLQIDIDYVSSTQQYLADRTAAGSLKKNALCYRPHLPFPVQVVSSIMTTDLITKQQSRERFCFHYGYYDDVEREFQGFGMVEHWDSEQQASSVSHVSTSSKKGTAILDAPPLYTKTWHHCGGTSDPKKYVSNFYEDDYYSGDVLAEKLSDSVLSLAKNNDSDPKKRTSEYYREATYALRGKTLRTETYAIDTKERPIMPPLQVSEANYTVTCIQQPDNSLDEMNSLTKNPNGVFFIQARENINYDYEQIISDPMIQRSIALVWDDYGNCLMRCQLHYPRRHNDGERYTNDIKVLLGKLYSDDLRDALRTYYLPQDWQKRGYILVQQARMINVIAPSWSNNLSKNNHVWDSYQHLGMASEHRTFELANDKLPTQFTKITVANLLAKGILPDAETVHPLTYKALPDDKIVAWQRRYYWQDAQQKAVLMLGEVGENVIGGSPPLFHHSEQLVGCQESLINDYTNTKLIDDKDITPYLSDKVGYRIEVNKDTNQHYCWSPSSVQHYDKTSQHYFMLSKITQYDTSLVSSDSLSQEIDINYDAYFIHMEAITRYIYVDPVKNEQEKPLVTSGKAKQVAVKSQSKLDYHTFAVGQSTDANGTVRDVLFDALGVVVATSSHGTVNGKALGGAVLRKSDNGQLTSLGQDLLQKAQNIDLDTALNYTLKGDLQGVETFSCYSLSAGQDSNNQHPNWTLFLLAEDYSINELDPLTKAALPVLTREPVQRAIAYRDGFNRVLQYKHQASAFQDKSNSKEDLYWIISSFKVYNNKNWLVQEYLPYRTDDAKFLPLETHAKNSQESTLLPATHIHYDALGRIERVTKPTGFLQCICRSPWVEVKFDQNDTILQAATPHSNTLYFDAKTGKPDEKAADDLLKLLQPTKAVEQKNMPEAIAKDDVITVLNSAKLHVDTPQVTVLDSLGRKRQQIELLREKDEKNNADLRTLVTNYKYDLSGRILSIKDPRINRPNMRYTYNKLGGKIVYDSADNGKSIACFNRDGKVLFQKNQRNFLNTYSYDQFQRLLTIQVQGGDGKEPVNFIAETCIYGESLSNPAKNNQYGQRIVHYHTAGAISYEAYDIAGNAINMTEQLFKIDITQNYDWKDLKPSTNDALSEKKYTLHRRFDALNRMYQVKYPDAEESVYLAGYNALGKLNRTALAKSNKSDLTWLVKKINYNAHGKRTQVLYGNEINRDYYYEPNTLKLSQLSSQNLKENLQQLLYRHDPHGNIIRIYDQPYAPWLTLDSTSQSSSQPSSVCFDYNYDTLSRVVQAATSELKTSPVKPGLFNTPKKTGLASGSTEKIMSAISKKDNSTMDAKTDPLILVKKQEKYQYDDSGNLTERSHQSESSKGEGWSLSYEAEKASNRLANAPLAEKTTISTDPLYDEQGNLLQTVPNQMLTWDYHNRLSTMQLTASNKPEYSTYHQTVDHYRYDARDQRRVKLSAQLTDPDKQIWTVTELVDLGVYQYERIYQRQGKSGELRLVSSCERLHLTDDRYCIATYMMSSSTNSNNTLIFHLDDHINSVTIDTDSRGQPLVIESYLPFGDSAYQVAIDAQMLKDKQFRYSSQQRDQSSDLYYYGERYYAPHLGRWISTDPIGRKGGLDLYGFVGDNPVSLFDLFGEAFLKQEVIDNEDEYVVKKTDRDSNAEEIFYWPESVQSRINCTPEKELSQFFERDKHMHPDVVQALEQYEENNSIARKIDGTNSYDINMDHKFSDRGIRYFIYDLIKNFSKDKLADYKQSVLNNIWDSKKQMRAIEKLRSGGGHDKLADRLAEETDYVTNRFLDDVKTAAKANSANKKPAKEVQERIVSGLNTISSQSVINLRPGDGPTNVTIISNFDADFMEQDDGNGGITRQYSPTTQKIASGLLDHAEKHHLNLDHESLTVMDQNKNIHRLQRTPIANQVSSTSAPFELNLTERTLLNYGEKSQGNSADDPAYHSASVTGKQSRQLFEQRPARSIRTSFRSTRHPSNEYELGSPRSHSHDSAGSFSGSSRSHSHDSTSEPMRKKNKRSSSMPRTESYHSRRSKTP